MNVRINRDFLGEIVRIQDVVDRRKIFDFFSHVKLKGLDGLPGRNKPSWEAPSSMLGDRRVKSSIVVARKPCLRHYHIGIDCYFGKVGDQTSRCVLHYKLGEGILYALYLNDHPPFQLPPYPRVASTVYVAYGDAEPNNPEPGNQN